jgi:ferrous-iron efflux pump FieF
MVAQPREETHTLWLTLAVYGAVFAVKLLAYFLSGIVVLLAEALHTLSDIFVSAFLFSASLYSRRKADAVHMFGYGRAQNIAALVAATLFISFTSLELYREALPRCLACWDENRRAQRLPIEEAVGCGQAGSRQGARS